MSKINQPQGPRVGNRGTPSKRSAFIAAKEAWAATAREIANAVGARATNPKSMTINRDKNQDQISPNTNKGRGPTRGNK